MNTVIAFILGLLVGWLVEWIIDWVYWRRRQGGMQAELTQLKTRLGSVEKSYADCQRESTAFASERTSLQEKLSRLEAENAMLRERLAEAEAVRAAPTRMGETWQAGSGVVSATGQAEAPSKPDDLQVIKGIGPVIAGKLNQAGIYTFKDLAAITPDRLREIVGKIIERLANEDFIIEQARHLADQGERGG